MDRLLEPYKTFLAEIRAFCRANGVSETRFGRTVANDPSFVAKLERGRRNGFDTVERVRAYMRENRVNARVVGRKRRGA